MINRFLALEILEPKGIIGKQSSLWMDLEVSKVSNVRRKVFFLFLRDSKPLRKLTSFFIEFVIYRNFLEQF